MRTVEGGWDSGERYMGIDSIRTRNSIDSIESEHVRMTAVTSTIPTVLVLFVFFYYFFCEDTRTNTRGQQMRRDGEYEGAKQLFVFIER